MSTKSCQPKCRGGMQGEPFGRALLACQKHGISCHFLFADLRLPRPRERDLYCKRQTYRSGGLNGLCCFSSMTAESGLGTGEHFQRSREPDGALLTIVL